MMARPREVSGPVNLGNPGEFSMLELAQKVIELTGSASQLVFRPLPADDPKQRQPDISKAKQLFDWQARVPLDQGLADTVAYFRDVLAAQAGSR